jgi:hypothetical protein
MPVPISYRGLAPFTKATTEALPELELVLVPELELVLVPELVPELELVVVPELEPVLVLVPELDVEVADELLLLPPPPPQAANSPIRVSVKTETRGVTWNVIFHFPFCGRRVAAPMAAMAKSLAMAPRILHVI